MSRRKLKLVLLGTMAIGALGSIAVPGVYAVYVAETRNTQATVSSGTLTMDLVVNGQPLGLILVCIGGPASALIGWLMSRRLARQLTDQV